MKGCGGAAAEYGDESGHTHPKTCMPCSMSCVRTSRSSLARSRIACLSAASLACLATSLRRVRSYSAKMMRDPTCSSRHVQKHVMEVPTSTVHVVALVRWGASTPWGTPSCNQRARAPPPSTHTHTRCDGERGVRGGVWPASMEWWQYSFAALPLPGLIHSPGKGSFRSRAWMPALRSSPQSCCR